MRLSQSQRMVESLKNNLNQKFTARELALKLISTYPEIYNEKRKNPRFQNDEQFLNQVIAELGIDRFPMLNYSKNVHWQDQPRPRVFWYDPNLLV